ncbi:hypothetical protein GCM10017688_29120 [Streptomyces ramulosus]
MAVQLLLDDLFERVEKMGVAPGTEARLTVVAGGGDGHGGTPGGTMTYGTVGWTYGSVGYGIVGEVELSP